MNNIPPTHLGMGNWADNAHDVGMFCRLLSQFIGKPITALEIGSFEGRSAVCFCELFGPAARVYCIDPWQDYQDLPAGIPALAESHFDANTKGRNIVKIKAESRVALPKLLAQGTQFDFIYIDGDHSTQAVLQDATNAWPLLKQNGIMAFDDYLWQTPDNNRPVLLAVDAFLHAMQGAYFVIEMGYRVFIVKT